MTRVLALSGGVGGAKLAAGLDDLLEPGELTVVCNTADDFEHLGLHIAPDLDSVLYALAGLNDTERGWGRADEGWRFMDALGQLGGETWFNLGDRDLATHVQRTLALRAGRSLSEATDQIRRALGIPSEIAPMSDQPVRTIIHTATQGDLEFQHYFVRERCEPAVTGFSFRGADEARPSASLERELQAGDLDAVIVCPSNPYVSVDPILAVPGVRALLQSTKAPIVGVSPIVGGEALKGPAAKMMAELGVPSSSESVARHYGARDQGGLLDAFVIDRTDAAASGDIRQVIPNVEMCNTVMTDASVRRSLARFTLETAQAVS